MLCVAGILLRCPKGLLHMGLLHGLHQLIVQQQPPLAALYEADVVPCAGSIPCQSA